MAESDLIKAQNEIAKQAKEDSARQISKITELLQQGKGDAKQRVQLLKMQEDLKKSQKNVSDDLGKNITDMKDGFMTSVDGMINQTFGPLGGMVTSLTTGFFKRGKENRENITQNELQNDNAKDLIKKMGGVQEVNQEQNSMMGGIKDTGIEQNNISSDMLENLVAIKESVAGVDDKTPKPDLDKDAAKKGGVGFLMSAEDKVDASDRPDEGGIVDKITDSIVTAAGVGGGLGGAAGVKALGGKYKALVGKLTGGVAGKVLSKANPVFAAITMGKDIFDIASAVTDDDVKTSVKKEDIGGLIGGFIGGAIGIIGGPAGVALGVGLGNMAGEFIGGAMESPDILGAIEKVKTNLKSEQTVVAEEIAMIEADIKAATDPIQIARLQAQKDQLTTRQTQITNELKAIEDENGEIAKQTAILNQIDVDSQTNRKAKYKLEKQIADATARGDSAMVARLTDRVTVLDEEFEKQEDDYAEQSEKLRQVARETSGALADSSTSLMDKIATEGGILGGFLSGIGSISEFFGGEGIGLKGKEKDKYLEEQMKKIDGKIAEQQALIDSGDNFDWALDPRTMNIAKLEREKKKLEGIRKEKSLARGGFIVNKPTYLPNSGVVVGEHGTYSGRGAAAGGIADGGPEAVIPLSSSRAGAFIDPMARSVAGQVMNQLQMERMSGGSAGMEGASVVTGNDMSSNQVDNSTTVINSPSPIGQMLPDEGRDFVSKVA